MCGRCEVALDFARLGRRVVCLLLARVVGRDGLAVSSEARNSTYHSTSLSSTYVRILQWGHLDIPSVEASSSASVRHD